MKSLQNAYLLGERQIWLALSLGLLLLSVTAMAQAPTLGIYPNTSVTAGQNTTVSPGAAPTNTVRASASANTNFTGVLIVNPTTGIVGVTNAMQAGTYMVTVTAFNSGGATATATFTLVVTDPACSQAVFNSTTNVFVGFSPFSVAIGDFNGDGRQDFAAANRNSDNVSIRLGNGMGGFTGTTNVPVGTSPRSVAIGDFNGDGTPDFATANFNSNTVSIRLGDGTGGFTGTTDVAVGTEPFSVAIGDFNGDGKQDFAAANANSNTVSIRLGDGSGGFSGTTNVAVGTEPCSVAIGDFNGDNVQDFVVANFGSNTVSIRLGDGSGGFPGTTDVPVGTSPRSVAIGDFNGDGVTDFAAANVNSATVSIRLGDGSGGFAVMPDVAVGNGPFSVAIGDFNGDGALDFAAANVISNPVSICLGVAKVPATLGTYPATTVIAGQNTTVMPDAAPTNTTSAVAYTNTNFTGVLTVNPATGAVTVTDAKQAGVYTVTVQAFNGDCVGATKTFTLTVTNPACSQALFSGTPDVSVGNVPNSVAIGDFNGDGRQDFATANFDSHTVSIRLGDGSGGFSGTTNVAVGANPTSVAIGDFNGDGRPDFATSNFGSKSVSIRLGDGLGGFSGTTNVSVGMNPISVAIGDFNGDGRPDFAAANRGSASVSIRLGDGSGGFPGATEVGAVSLPQSVAIGDFNGDGKQDFAAANFSSNAVSIRLGDGLGGFTGTGTVSVGANPISIAIGDFNEDGKQDFAAANFNSASVSIRLGDGLGGFTGTTNIAVGTEPRSVAIGDFNGDGKQDFAAANGSSNNVSIHLGDGSGGFFGTGTVSVGTEPRSVAIGDFNRDGVQDFVAANQSSATVSIRLGGENNINVRGNGMEIMDGDATPDIADHSDFGQTTGAPITRTFTIQNTGNVALSLGAGAITLTGANANLFSVNNISLPATVNGPSGSITFDVTYTPLGVGVHTANVVIANDDCDEATYDFAIRGEQICITPTFTACPSAPVTANTAPGFCSAAVTYSVMANGTPDPTLTYVFTGMTTGSGSGTGSGSMFNKGNTTVTVTASNACSAPTCVFTVSVEDHELPVIHCPSNRIVQADAGQCSAVQTYTITSSDNCPGSTTVQTNGFPSGTAFPVGFNVVNWQVTDASGNSTACSFSITVTDNQKPGIVCPTNLFKTTDANQCTAVVTYNAPTFSDNCGGAYLTRVSGPASGGVFPKGTTMVNWLATDASGNSAICGFTVTVNDGQAPTITCPVNVVKGTDAGQCTAVATYTSPVFTDNCTGASATLFSGLGSGSTFQKGVSTIVWKVTDRAGLAATCAFTVTVNDNQAPVITCPGNQTKNTDAGQCTAVTTYPTPTFTDNCTGGNVTIQSGLGSGSAFPKGINTVVWKATDAAGLTKTCSFRVTVNDAQAPAIACPANQSKTTDAGLCTAVATYNLATFTDNCTGGSVVKLSGLASGAAFPKGTSQVLFKATDAAGNQSLCSMTVTVTDAQLPVITCPGNVIVVGSTINGVCSATVNYNQPAASDNCGILSNFLESGLANGSVFPQGTTTNIWRATDNNGLTATCAFTVTVGCGTNSSSEFDLASGERSSKFEMPTLEHGQPVNMRLAPNPATAEVQVILEGLTESGGQLTVFDAQGRVVLQQFNVQHPTSNIDVSNLPSGLYQVHLQTENGLVTKGLVVNRL